MGIDIKPDDLAHFLDLDHSGTSASCAPLNCDLRRQTPFAYAKSVKYDPKTSVAPLVNGDSRRQTPLSSKSSRNSDGPGGRAMTRILSPTFLWDFSHQIHMFLTVRQKYLTIF